MEVMATGARNGAAKGTRGKIEEGQRKIIIEEKGNGKRVAFKKMDKEKKEREGRMSDQKKMWEKEAMEQCRKEEGGQVKKEIRIFQEEREIVKEQVMKEIKKLQEV